MEDIKIWVNGSTDGVRIAPTIVEPNITYLQIEIIVLPEMIRNKPSIICITGNWKARPVLNNNTSMNSKYCSKDQKGSTTSDP